MQREGRLGGGDVRPQKTNRVDDSRHAGTAEDRGENLVVSARDDLAAAAVQPHDVDEIGLVGERAGERGSARGVPAAGDDVEEPGDVGGGLRPSSSPGRSLMTAPESIE